MQYKHNLYRCMVQVGAALAPPWACSPHPHHLPGDLDQGGDVSSVLELMADLPTDLISALESSSFSSQEGASPMKSQQEGILRSLCRQVHKPSVCKEHIYHRMSASYRMSSMHVHHL